MSDQNEFMAEGAPVSVLRSDPIWIDNPASPVAATGTQTVEASDGSTISISVDRQGAITATGVRGQTLVITQGSNSEEESVTTFTFSETGPGTYLTLGKTVDAANSRVGVTMTAGTSTVSLELTAAASGQTGEAILSGQIGAETLSWSGQVNLEANPLTAPGAVPGWQPSAFKSALQRAAYFDPALSHLPWTTQTVGPEPLVSTGGSIIKATGWGVATMIGAAVIVAATGGVATPLLVLAIADAGLAAADASLLGDVVDQWNSQAQTTTTTTTTTDTSDDNDGDDGDGSGCFAPGTLVAVDAGSRRAIEDLAAGDVVMSRNELTGDTAPQRISRTWIHQDNPTVELQLESGESIFTTSLHRLFTAERGVVAVSGLSVGDHVQTLTRGNQQITEIRPGSDASTVYNLTVDEYHTYFVGTSGVWVHNDKELPDPGDDAGDPVLGDDGDD
jgi:pretoxin HINT domain-containing protein